MDFLVIIDWMFLDVLGCSWSWDSIPGVLHNQVGLSGADADPTSTSSMLHASLPR